MLIAVFEEMKDANQEWAFWQCGVKWQGSRARRPAHE